MYVRLFIALLLTAGQMSLIGQSSASYRLFHNRNEFKSFGIFSGIGMVKAFADSPRSFTDHISEVTRYDVRVSGQGNTAPFLELGGFSILKYGPIRMVDFGFSYRKVSGSELAQGFLQPGSDLSYPDLLNVKGEFIHHRTAFRMNFNMVFPLGRTAFFHTGPGLDARMTIRQKEQYDLRFLDLRNTSDVRKTAAGVNYMVGLGWKAGNGVFMDFYTYTSLMNIERENFRSTEPLFNSEFRLITFGLRLMWMRPEADRSCPTYQGSNRSGARFPANRGGSGDRPW
jgi:hypothetical protein